MLFPFQLIVRHISQEMRTATYTMLVCLAASASMTNCDSAGDNRLQFSLSRSYVSMCFFKTFLVVKLFYYVDHTQRLFSTDVLLMFL